MMTFRPAGHPPHPLFVHFPVALWGITPAWDLLGLLRGGESWWLLGFWCAAAGTTMAVPAVITGFIDSMALPEQGPARPTAVRHMMAVAIAGALYLGYLLLRRSPAPPEEGIRLWALLLSVAGLAALLVGGFLGGRLVYTHGAGRAPE